MGLHLYALLPAGAGAPAAGGIDRAPIIEVPVGPLIALATEHAAAPPPSLDHVRAHNAVIAAAFQPPITPVPLRFGQFLADADAVRRRLGDAEPWLTLLHRLAGHAEYGVRMQWAVEEQEMHTAEASGAGSRHMNRLMQRHAAGRAAREQAAALEEMVREVTRGTVADIRADHSHAGQGTLGIALLVAGDQAPAYCSAVDGLPAQRPDVRFVFTGPWPPYSFVP